MAGSGQERRQHKRVPFIQDIKIIGGGTVRSTEISTGGMYLEMIQIYPDGAVLDLQFKLRNTDEKPIKVQARLLYKHSQVGIGLCFLNLTAEDRAKIEKYVDQAGM
jgi:hypothetical protein